MFSGFISKLLFAQAAVESRHKLLLALIALAISTILNAMYFMKTVIRLYTPEKKSVIKKKNFVNIKMKDQPLKSVVLICFIILNLILGLCSEPIIKLFQQGLEMFA